MANRRLKPTVVNYLSMGIGSKVALKMEDEERAPMYNSSIEIYVDDVNIELI